jgi:DNA polymerase-3 subunit alpha
MNYDEKLDNEKEMLGFYLSGHPLEQYEDLLEFYATVTSESLYEHRYDAEVYVIGMISEVRVVTTKKSGDRMAIVTLEDLEGSVPMVIFPETYEVSRALIEKNKVVWVRGDISVDMRSKKTDDDGNEIDARQIQVNEVVAIEDLVESKTSSVEVVIPKVTIPEPIEQLKKLCAKYRGEHDLILRLTDSKFGEVIVQCGGKFRIKDSENAIKDIESLF